MKFTSQLNLNERYVNAVPLKWITAESIMKLVITDKDNLKQNEIEP